MHCKQFRLAITATMVGCYMKRLAQIRFSCRVCEDEQSDNIINHHIFSDFVVAAQIQGITNMAIICELIDCKDRRDVFTSWLDYK